MEQEVKDQVDDDEKDDDAADASHIHVFLSLIVNTSRRIMASMCLGAPRNKSQAKQAVFRLHPLRLTTND